MAYVFISFKSVFSYLCLKTTKHTPHICGGIKTLNLTSIRTTVSLRSILCSLTSNKHANREPNSQAGNQLGTPEGAKSFLRGAQNF